MQANIYTIKMMSYKTNKVILNSIGIKAKNFKYNKLINKSVYLSTNLNIRRYSTNSNLKNDKDSNYIKSIEGSVSYRLNYIIEELKLDPVYIFENLDSEIIRKEILNKTKGLSGIYMIVNKTTKDYYIGSASTNKFYSRFSNHLIYFRGSKIVKLAVKKYDLKNFAFMILELFPNLVTKENNKELLDLEDKYLK